MGELFTHALDALWEVIAVGLVLGAGLPALFALGLRAFYGELPTHEAAHAAQADEPPPGAVGANRALGYLYFGIVVAAALFGIVVIVFGKQIFG